MCPQPPPNPKASIHPQGWWPPYGLPELVEPISLSTNDGTAATTARGIRARVQEALTQGKEGRGAPSSFPQLPCLPCPRSPLPPAAPSPHPKRFCWPALELESHLHC